MKLLLCLCLLLSGCAVPQVSVEIKLPDTISYKHKGKK